MENLINEIQNAKTQAVRKIIVKFHRGGDWVTSDFLNLLKERNTIHKEKNRNPDNQSLDREFQKFLNLVTNKRR